MLTLLLGDIYTNRPLKIAEKNSHIQHKNICNLYLQREDFYKLLFRANFINFFFNLSLFPFSTV